MDDNKIKDAINLWNNGKSYEAGKLIYENLENEKRPCWAGKILAHCQTLVASIAEIDNVYVIASAPERWKEAHNAFTEVRRLTLQMTDRPVTDDRLSKLLLVTEYAAKVIYNASGEPAPFDENSGPRLIKALADLVNMVGNLQFEEQAKRIACCLPAST